MAVIKVKQDLRGVFTLKWALVFSMVVTLLLSNKVVHILNGEDYISNFSGFFASSALMVFYGSLIGLLLAAYTIIISLIPLFSAESLKQPIFGHVNRIFLFTIMDGIFLMVVYFTYNILPIAQIPYFIYIEVFMFFALLFGLVFCVLSLSDLFKIVRKRGER